MNNQLFNSTFEMELRLLLLLGSERKARSIDWLINMDFIICYAEEFQLPYNSLHGNKQLMYGELSSRRMLAQDAIKQLVVKGLVEVEINGGYVYAINLQGKHYSKLLKSDYASNYREIAKAATKMFKSNSDIELGKIIQNNALRAVRKGG